jgi:mannose-6-phosphate isomerase-like protein (cupin superfamily)
MISRRDLVLSSPAIGLLLESLAASSQTTLQPASGELGHSTVFSASHLPIKTGPTGSFQHVATGNLATGEPIEIHNTVLKPGQMPHPPHRHVHTEFMIIHQGTLSWMLGEITMPVSAGDILYARSNELHGLKNTGETEAKYAVIAIGADAGR